MAVPHQRSATTKVLHPLRRLAPHRLIRTATRPRSLSRSDGEMARVSLCDSVFVSTVGRVERDARVSAPHRAAEASSCLPFPTPSVLASKPHRSAAHQQNPKNNNTTHTHFNNTHIVASSRDNNNNNNKADSRCRFCCRGTFDNGCGPQLLFYGTLQQQQLPATRHT